MCPLPVADRQPVPDLTLPMLPSDAALAAGATELSLVDLEGQVVIVNFRASWCGPCRIEQPGLNAVHDLLPDTEVVLVRVDIEDTEANALDHLAEFAAPDLSAFDPVNELASSFDGIGARTSPSTVLLDTEGRVAPRRLGLPDTHEMAALGQRPVEWWISVRSSTMVFMLGGLKFERDGLLEVEDGRAVHGEVAAV